MPRRPLLRAGDQAKNPCRGEACARGQAIQPRLPRTALPDAGKEVTSCEFTAMFSRLRGEALDVALAIRGPEGHGEALKSAAHFQLSLGRMTPPHGLVRIVLAEQLYRAVTIMQGRPYHRG